MRAWLIVIASCAACGPIAPVRESRAPIVAALVREPCLDGCPIYAVTIYADGTVQYDGVGNVDVVGRRVSHVDAQAIATLRERFADSGWAQTGAIPWGGCYDLATVTVTLDGKTLHWMLGDQVVPSNIAGLDFTIDTVAGTDRWVGAHWRVGHCP